MSKVLAISVFVLASALELVACSQSEAPPASAPVEKPAAEAAAPVPDHYYSIVDGQDYGYEPARTTDDDGAGRVGSTMVMFRYLGMRDGKIQVASILNRYAVSVADCEQPCYLVRMRTFVDGRMVKKEFMRVDPAAIVRLAIEDAKNGKLAVFKTKSGKTAFYGDDDRVAFNK